MDPLEFRLKNYAEAQQVENTPFSTKELRACYREGAERFGWSRRPREPRSLREGSELIGWGMATGQWEAMQMQAQVHAALGADGKLVVSSAASDIGTGSYTVFTQIAAEMLGLPVEKVRIELGDSDFPETPGSGGSWGAASAGSALFDACTALRGQIARRLGARTHEVVFADGRATAGTRSETLGALAGTLGLRAEGQIRKGDMAKKFSQQAYGAHFAEVAVDMDTGEIRVRRMLGVFAAGRILNMKTATSQATGAMIWGVGSALFEDAVIDPRFGAFVNHDLAEYHVPSHADIPSVEAMFLDEVDDKTNPLKIKGVGELGICGAGAAVANAVYNATGVRIRDYPLTLDKLMRLPALQG
jgi:xanthine dehydrogenase YagR molybdenum-binding subunit